LEAQRADLVPLQPFVDAATVKTSALSTWWPWWTWWTWDDVKKAKDEKNMAPGGTWRHFGSTSGANEANITGILILSQVGSDRP
jgi:hypothetical protein